MSSAGVHADGLTQLVSSLDRASVELQDFTEPHRQATSLLVSAAAPSTPRLTGTLAAGTRSDASPKVGTVYNASDHAVPTHWGAPAKHIRAQPWLVETLTKVESRMVAQYEQHVETTLDTIQGT